MAGIRFAEVQPRPMEFLDLTSLTLDEFEQLAPRAWRSWGKSKKSGRTASAIHLSLQAREPSQTCQTALWHFATMRIIQKSRVRSAGRSKTPTS